MLSSSSLLLLFLLLYRGTCKMSCEILSRRDRFFVCMCLCDNAHVVPWSMATVWAATSSLALRASMPISVTIDENLPTADSVNKFNNQMYAHKQNIDIIIGNNIDNRIMESKTISLDQRQ